MNGSTCAARAQRGLIAMSDRPIENSNKVSVTAARHFTRAEEDPVSASSEVPDKRGGLQELGDGLRGLGLVVIPSSHFPSLDDCWQLHCSRVKC